MKKIIAMNCLFVLLLVGAPTLVADEPTKRTAVFEDLTGTKVDLADLLFVSDWVPPAQPDEKKWAGAGWNDCRYGNRFQCHPHIGSWFRETEKTNLVGVVTAAGFHVGVHADDLIAIEKTTKKESIYEVRFRWLDRETTASGRLSPGHLEATSDVGEANIPLNQIRRLVFNSPPVRRASSAAELLKEGCVVVALRGGAKVPVKGLRTYYYSSCWAGTYTGPDYFGGFLESLPYAVGPSQFRLDFSKTHPNSGKTLNPKVRSLIFGDRGRVSVVRTDAKTIQGTVLSEMPDDLPTSNGTFSGRQYVLGFSGVNEMGPLFFPLEHVAEIRVSREDAR